jgi:hypothetical protein
MPNHVVEQGECLQKIAHRHGFPKPFDIWSHPKNKDLRVRRKDDPNVLFPGDVLWIPEKKEKTLEKDANDAYTFKVPSLGKKLRIAVRDAADEPLAGEDYELEVAGKKHTGKTDGAGLVEAVVPAQASAGKLRVGAYTWKIAVGSLDPVVHTEDEGISGIQARLRNLGYLPEHAYGKPCEKTRDAISRFQRAHGLAPTGVADAATRQKLEAAHKDEVKPQKPAPATSGFSVRVVDALPETPPLCAVRGKKAKKKPEPHAVAPTATNVLAPARKGKCGLCTKQLDCLDNDYDFLLAVAQMAARLGGDAGALLGIMHFETGHTYSSKIQNKIGATGLIQIIPSTAKGLGTTTNELKAMCRIEQLAWVEKYFESQKKSYPRADYTKVRDVVLAVFEPIGLDPSHDILGVSATECAGPFAEVTSKGKKRTYWTANHQGQQIRVSKHQRDVYRYNAGLDRDKDGFVVRDDYPAIVEGLLATCAKEAAEKVRAIQKSLAGPPEYKILRPA